LPGVAAGLRGLRVSASGVVVPFGITSASLRELPRVTGQNSLDVVLTAIGRVGVRDVELALSDVEPAPPSVTPFIGGSPAYPVRVTFTPEQITRLNQQARADLRRWRLQSGRDVAPAFKAKIAEARVKLVSVATVFDDSFTDDELDATFAQVVGLGSRTVASPLTKAMALRVKPYAERYGVVVAVHNPVESDGAGQISSTSLDAVLELSPAFHVKLDVGHVTASNGDALADLEKYRARLAYVVVKDRLRNGGGSQPFGEGDTPIAKVIGTLKSWPSTVPVLVEYDYVGLRSAVDELTSSIKYVTEAAR
jgi:sugar phosphate isomerase/epimerase